MKIFKRLFKIGQAEAHSAVDKMEDPIKLTEQGIRDMKDDLNKSLEALAQVKALEIRAKNDVEKHQAMAEDYQNKAMLLLQRAKKGELQMDEAERLAKEALLRKEENQQLAATAETNYNKFTQNVNDLNGNIKKIKSNIAKWENELKTLKARVKVSDATKNLNKQLAEIDTSSTVSMLERMKLKVEEEEALAEAYGDMAEGNTSIDEEINNAVDLSDAKAEMGLEELKKQMGLDNNENS